MTHFTTTRLVGSRVLIKGQDVFGVEGQTIVSSEQWDEIGADKAYSQAEADFNAAVEDFFKPLTEAAEKMHKAVEKPADSIGYVVLQEGEEGKPAVAEQLIKLTHDSIVLRLIEQNPTTNRLVWVGDELEVLTETPAPANVGSVQGQATGE